MPVAISVLEAQTLAERVAQKVMPRIHPTAIVEDSVEIGAGSSVWDNVHIRHGTRIGEDCIIGEKSCIAYDVSIADRVKINSFVYICTAVTIETGVMISAGTIFTNDRFPRATTADLRELRSSDPDEETLPTLVREGSTIGAGCVIGCDLEIGRFAMVGMASVVTKSIGDFHLVVGHPAKLVGFVCRCGRKIGDCNDSLPGEEILTCKQCQQSYLRKGTTITEMGS